ncbi:hypothetical protein Taro_042563 [Colocasia esculenta]|uniref:ATPase AAA-type core domain-containing protein n=1 Tax=Colocasia esculenta TaxID=4460 RepID=A0A843WYT8_COLES|nr:hypothetical protein [Colocasia esculenta]
MDHLSVGNTPDWTRDSLSRPPEKIHTEVQGWVISQLLTLMDGLKAHAQVVVIAATKSPDSVDPALRRFGRLDSEIDVGVLDELGRLEILRIHTRNMRLSEDVDLERVSKNTQGIVGTDLGAVCTEAALQCTEKRWT